jgi:RNA polymerase sigma-70 factor (ECF subfamily)
MTLPDPTPDRDVEALLREHLPGLRGFIRLRTGPFLRSLEETTDLVQSVCREILQHKDRFQHDDHGDGFRKWLYTTALRKIGKRGAYYRAQKREAARNVSIDGVGEGSNEGAAELLGCYDKICTPSHVVRAREEVSRIEQAFDELPDHYREVITLSRIAGLTHAEIAERTDQSEGAVRMQLYRGLERLSEILGGPR